MSKIILKKSSVPGKVPATGDLDFGELALNYADGKIFYKTASNTIAELGGGGGGGNLTVSATPPTSPKVGDGWVDSATGIKYTYLNDGNSSQWVELEADVSISTGSSTTSTSVSSIYSAEHTLSGTTNNSTETEVFIDGISNSRIAVPLNKTIYYTADVVCRRTDASGDHAAFYIKGVATNVSGTVTDVGLIYEAVVARTDANFAVDFRADDTNNSVGMYVTGNTGKTLLWKCALTVLEV
jgi:hypothetical protein